MGITGLLPFLKAIQREIHLSSFRGKKAAVDSYCWLHKGAYSCAMQLIMGTANVDTLPFIRYCMKRVTLLRQYDITPIMVFDGGYLPTKSKTEKERRERRQGYLAKGKQFLKDGRKTEANDCFQKCVDVSPAMALALIKACRKIGVECVVAPYEADAQLAYLKKEGIVDFVITEDSDLLVFGCQKVFFKMDDSGNGKLIDLNDLGKANKGLVGFTQDSFRQMCIFSGCDYLPSVPGIGLGKALKLMRKCNQNSSQVFKALHFETGKVPKNYEEDFRRAEYTFLYQLVFDPRSQRQVRLNQLPDNLDSNEFEFAGVEHSPKKAVHMARGNIDPISLQVLDSYSPSKAPPPKSTSWEASAMGGPGKNYPLAIQAKLPLTSSEKSKDQFRAPKRVLLTFKDEEMLAEDDLCSMYTNTEDLGSKEFLSARSKGGDKSVKSVFSTSLSSLAGMELRNKATDMRATVVKSRYFKSSSPECQSQSGDCSEETPTENPDGSHMVKRNIFASGLESVSNSLKVPVEAQSLSDEQTRKPESAFCDSEVCSKEGRMTKARKKLFGFAFRKEKQATFTEESDYPTLKRQRVDFETEDIMNDMQESENRHPFLLLEKSPMVSDEPDHDSAPNESSQNPFSVSRPILKTSPDGSTPNERRAHRTSPVTKCIGMEDSVPNDLIDLTTSSVSGPQDSLCKHSLEVNADTVTPSLTSADLITPYSCATNNSSLCGRLLLVSGTPRTVIQFEGEPSRKEKEDLEIMPQSMSVKRDSNSPVTQGNWFGTRHTSLAPNKGRVKVAGLSKSTSRSKFKPPRLADSISNQTTLSAYGYTKKLQMKK